MMYWGEDADLTSCKFCNHPRFKNKRDSGKPNKYVPHKMIYYFHLSPRLQQLYALEAIAAHMRWHDEHQQDDGKCVIHLILMHGSISVGHILHFLLNVAM